MESRPFTGAWIETWSDPYHTATAFGRPFTGAWIETLEKAVQLAGVDVAPSRGRGLKPPCSPYWLRMLTSPLHGGVD